MKQAIEKNFFILVILAGLCGFILPGVFSMALPYLKILLGLIMFSMGLSLRFEDFKLIFLKPRAVILGVCLQYILMPFIAYLLASLLNLPAEIAVGMILVGACPGGTASNLITYLSKGDLALSVSMTSISTMLAPILTPALVLLFARQWFEVDGWALFVSLLQVILIPISLALLFKFFFLKQASNIEKASSSLAIFCIMVIIASLVAANIDVFGSPVFQISLVLFAVLAHNLLGLFAAYFFAKGLAFGESKSRAVSIEVGMQNSGLAAVLALAHFSPLAALPAVIFSVWHNLSGSMLASYWSRR